MDVDLVVGLAGLVLAVGSVLLSVYLYQKSRRDKEPCWAIRTINLVRDRSSRLSGIEVRYEGATVTNLSVSKVVFWNQGSEIIDGQDIVPDHPIRLEGRRATRILVAKLLATNNEASNIALTITDGRGTIAFDYLGASHGGVFQVVHDGRSSRDLTVVGTIKGADRIRRIEAEFDHGRPPEDVTTFEWPSPPAGRRQRRIRLLLPFTTTGVLVAVRFGGEALGLPNALTWGFVAGAVVFVVGVVLAYRSEDRIIPKELARVFSDTDTWG